MRGVVIPVTHAKCDVKRALAGPDRVLEVQPGLPVERRVEQARGGPEQIFAQLFTEARQTEAKVLILLHDLHGLQCSQQPLEGRLVRVAFGCQVSRGPGPSSQTLRKLKRHRHRDRLRLPVRGYEAVHGDARVFYLHHAYCRMASQQLARGSETSNL